MQHLKVKGLVLRETNFGDNDRYISVLTEAGSRIEVLCRGARRRGGRMVNAVRLFCWSELTLYESRGKYTLNEAELLESFWGISESVENYALGCYFSELVSAMTDTDEEIPAITRLLLGALYALTRQKRLPEVIKPAFELRLMAESGYAPDISVCGACGQLIEGTAFFSVRDGAMLDADCLRRLGSGGFVPVPRGTYAAMQHILTSELPRVYAFALGGDSLRVLGELCESYALFHAERGFDSLKFYHSLF